jgi:hypothetical protein
VGAIVDCIDMTALALASFIGVNMHCRQELADVVQGLEFLFEWLNGYSASKAENGDIQD